MLRPYEVRFTEAFLAELVKQDVDSFPFGDDSFTRGVSRMAETARGNDSVRKYQIGYLFKESPVSGDYSRFLSVLNYLNGKRLSLENPRLITARVKIVERAADMILQETPDDLRELAREAAISFKVALAGGA